MVLSERQSFHSDNSKGDIELFVSWNWQASQKKSGADVTFSSQRIYNWRNQSHPIIIIKWKIQCPSFKCTRIKLIWRENGGLASEFERTNFSSWCVDSIIGILKTGSPCELDFHEHKCRRECHSSTNLQAKDYSGIYGTSF